MTTLGSRLRRDDAGSIVFGWLGRVALTLTILGVAAFEVLSIVVAHVSLDDIGQTAADRALTAYTDTHDPYQAYVAANDYVDENDAVLVKKSFTITSDSVSFELKKTAPTLLLYRLDATAHLAEVHTTIYQEPFVEGGSMP
jgi:hypothetical protein